MLFFARRLVNLSQQSFYLHQEGSRLIVGVNFTTHPQFRNNSAFPFKYFTVYIHIYIYMRVKFIQIKFHGNSSNESNMKIRPEPVKICPYFLELKSHFLIHQISSRIPKLAR
jgi:hypothetical protein